MSYYKIDATKLNRKLINTSDFDKDVIVEFLEDVPSINSKTTLDNVYIKSTDREFIANEINKLIKEDLSSTKAEFDLDEFGVQYFFCSNNPITKTSSISCELKNKEGGAVIYDIVRIGKAKDEFNLFIPVD